MNKQDILNDLIKIFKDNTDEEGLTSVHGVYDSMKEYMLKLKLEIELERK